MTGKIISGVRVVADTLLVVVLFYFAFIPSASNTVVLKQCSACNCMRLTVQCYSAREKMPACMIATRPVDFVQTLNRDCNKFSFKQSLNLPNV